MTPSERSKQWRKTNKWRYNKYQREYQARMRQNNLSGGVVADHVEKGVVIRSRSSKEADSTVNGNILSPEIGVFAGKNQSQIGSSAPNAQRSKIDELRELIKVEHEKIVEEPVKPLIFRNDYGAVISEHAWKLLQKKKEAAAKGGYVLDDYSQ